MKELKLNGMDGAESIEFVTFMELNPQLSWVHKDCSNIWKCVLCIAEISQLEKFELHFHLSRLAAKRDELKLSKFNTTESKVKSYSFGNNT